MLDNTNMRTEIYPVADVDRRIRPHQPAKRGANRRGSVVDITADDVWDLNDKRDGIETDSRYHMQVPVKFYRNKKDSAALVECMSVDISRTGMLVEFKDPEMAENFEEGKPFFLRFFIPPGDMPEGYESAVNVQAKVIRVTRKTEDGPLLVAFAFDKKLSQLIGEKRWRLFEVASMIFLFFTFLFILLLKRESVYYFLFDTWVFFYGLCAALFLVSRFLFAAFYWNKDPVLLPTEEIEASETGFKYDYAPPVSIIIPCFNEEEWIVKTIRSCLDQYYPTDRLEVIVVDDASTDNSAKVVQAFCDKVRDTVGDSLRFLPQKVNKGKREALAVGALAAKHEFLIFVDSDSFLTPEAVVQIVQPFKDPKMGAVSGRTEVENKWTNALTKMQAVRYYIAFRVLKGAEAVFDAITCLSGPLACYRKELVLKYMDEWLAQKFLGHRATFGDDRSMTNFILNEYRTGYQDKSVCYTIVPSKIKTFMRQQMRWKRSWLRESLRAAGFMWRKEPFAALSFYSGFSLPVLAPIVTLHALIFVPVVYGVFPSTFLVGIILMSMLISASYLLLKRSRLWIYGVLFCAFYMFVLLWQMFPAVFTFWKSEWGTRATPADVLAEQKKEAKKKSKLGVSQETPV